jgi:hypothetical protein
VISVGAPPTVLNTLKAQVDVVPRPISRTDVIATLNRLKSEGAIVSFRTNFFEKTANAQQIEVTPPADSTLADTLRRVQNALEPLNLDLAVVIRLSARSREAV